MSDPARDQTQQGALTALLEALVRAPSTDVDAAWEHHLAPGERLGRFEILREIGRGGFGAVYEALDVELGRRVALKTLRPARSRQELSADWIRKEAEAVARLDHPAIVTLFDVGTCSSGPYLVEELLRGQTLEERLRRAPLPVADAVGIALDIARALAHAHDHGVLHRDLKPANIFLTDDGRVKLLDFGLAFLLGTRGFHGAGTPAYMAPEQARGDAVDARADVFALGVVLFEMLVGRRPFEVKDGRTTALDGEPPRWPHDVAPALARVVDRALARDPAQRPPNGDAMAEALLEVRRSLAGGPKRRARIVLASAAAALVAIIAGWGVFRWTTRRPASGSDAAASSAATAPLAKKSIAVLPFVDMTEKHDQEYFSDGLSEEVIDRLSHSPDLTVIARTSSFQFKGRSEDMRSIARKLGVTHLLEGSVRKAGDDVRITAQLIRASDGAHVWSQAYNRKLSDIFEVQDDIAGTVARALNAALRSGAMSGGQARVPSKEAYNQVLLGTYFFNRQAAGDDERAYNAFVEATRIDPDYALAWAKLARATDKRNPDGRAKALAAARRALSIDPDLAYAHYVLGRHLFYQEWDWAGAKVELERAIELDPDHLPARVDHAYLTEGMFGRFDRKIGYLRQIVANDPLDPFSLEHLATTFFLARRFEEAGTTWQRLLELNPAWPGGYADAAKALLFAGRSREALAVALKERDEGAKQYALALVHWGLGHRLEADAALAWLEKKEAEDPGSHLDDLVEVHAYRGEADAAFRLLDRAFQSLKNRTFMALITVDPLLRSLHGDPRYEALLARLKLNPK